MGRYQAYPEYKDTGVEWFGSIPEHWYLSKVKFLTTFQVGWTPPTKDDANFEGDNLWANISDLKGREIFDTTKRISDYAAKVASMDISPAGSLLYSFKLSVGAVSFAGKDMYTNEAIATFLSKSKLPLAYLYYVLPLFVIENASTNIYGARILNQELIRDAFLLSPPYNEAETIANFLDHETAKIDTLIEQQQQLIQLLKEKRQAVISHAVTKGLNPNAPMKDSGVEWLSEVPAHWELPKIKWFCKTESGGTPNTGKYEEYYLDGEIPWIRTTDLNNNDLMDTPIRITKKAVNDSACALLPINSVLIAMYGGAGSIGKHSLLKFESTINQAVCAVLPNQKILPEFLHLYVEFYRPYWMVGAEGTRKDPNINQDTIRELVTPCPPKTEQAVIVAATKKSLSTIDSIIERSESNIELMQERRTALISAAVTGKIDVRNWQAPNY